jgi:acyl-CoA hydrolase
MGGGSNRMENYKLVLPGHLNHYGYLFGGYLLLWVDEISWIAASRDFPGCNFVTVGMDRVAFRESIRNGSILRFEVTKQAEGRTSVKYDVNVYCEEQEIEEEKNIFSTVVTFVCLDNQGSKCALR